MKMQILSTKLLRALEEAILSVPKSTPMYILENFNFNIVNDSITIRSTNLESYYEKTIPITSEGESNFLIPARLCYDLIRSLSDEEALLDVLELEIQENKITVKKGKKTFKLPIITTIEDYPDFPDLSDAQEIVIDRNILLEAIAFSLNQISDEDIRPSICSMNLELTEEKTNAVATNGRVLSYFNISENATSSIQEQYLLPKESLNKIIKIKGNNFKIKANKSYAEFITETGTIFTTRLIGDKYPKYDQVIPKDNKFTAKFNKSELLKTIKRLNILNEGDEPKITISFAGTETIISAENINTTSSGIEKINCEYLGEDLTIAFNYKLLSQVVGNFQSKEVIMSISGALLPIIIKSKVEDSNYCLVMPMRIN